MNDAIVFATCFAVALCVIACGILYSTYRGVNDSLANAATGSVYNFRYFQPVSGDYQRYLAKVINVRKFTNEELSRLNWHSDYRSGDKEFKRSPTLVTCEMSNGDIRQFYAERSDMCKRTVVGNLLFKVGLTHLF